MEDAAWRAFSALRGEFRSLVRGYAEGAVGLGAALRSIAADRDYPLETPVVYNSALDAVGEGDAPKLVLVADNPGMKEQLAANRRYLVGQSGKLAAAFFSGPGAALGVDFYRDVLLLNKTPVHTPRTVDLRGLPAEFSGLIERSQADMARLAVGMAGALGVPLWIVGYSEMGPRGLFARYSAELRALRGELGAAFPETLLFRHFSMNQFAVDFKRERARLAEERGVPAEAVGAGAALESLGAGYRRKYLGF